MFTKVREDDAKWFPGRSGRGRMTIFSEPNQALCSSQRCPGCQVNRPECRPSPAALSFLLPTLTAPRQLPKPHMLSIGTAVCTIDMCTVIGSLKKVKTSKPNFSIVTMQLSLWFTAGYILSARGPASRY